MTTTTTLSELTGDYVLDTERTRIGFVAKHRMATRVRGHFAVFEGALRLDGDNPAGSSASMTIRADSIDTGDKRRDAQLSKDFLDVATYPTITFVSTEVERVGETRFDVTGDLTIRGTTHSVTVPFELTGTAGGVAFTGTRTIDRSRWRVNWNALTTFLVVPNVVLDLEVTATRHR